jgi:mycothiol synthase
MAGTLYCVQMHAAASKPLRINQSSHDDQTAALRLLLSRLSADARPRHIAAWADALAASQADLWVAHRDQQLAGAILAQVQPGHTAVVLPPRVALGEPRKTASELLAHVTSVLTAQGVRLLQALLETSQREDADAFAEDGFRDVANLFCLVSLAGSFPAEPPQNGLEFVPYAVRHHDRFSEIVEQTYEGSLDCPPLNQVREIEDVLAGYRGIGQFDDARWLIARHGAADVGCLLLADHPAENAHELVYMGLVPAARGQRFGVALARQAQWLTAQAGRSRITTAVDADNGPAIAAYTAAGFLRYGQRRVLLRVLA